jgi:hypothetical protein
MTSINEKYSLNDENIKTIKFPKIKDNRVPILLVYEASKSLHDIDIRKLIIQFLLLKKAHNLKSFVNSSIYFELSGDYYPVVIEELNTEFEKYIAPYEKDETGKVIWLFNYLLKSDSNKFGTSQIGMIGKGNISFNERFQALKEKVRNILILIRRIRQGLL